MGQFQPQNQSFEMKFAELKKINQKKAYHFNLFKLSIFWKDMQFKITFCHLFSSNLHTFGCNVCTEMSLFRVFKRTFEKFFHNIETLY